MGAIKQIGGILDLREDWEKKTPVLRKKTAELTGQKSTEYNPFTDKNGNLLNKFIDYQGALDNPNVSNAAKNFIQKATGLTPTKTVVSGSQAINPAVANIQTVAPSATGNTIADSAAKYIGTPYVWGGESMQEGGMDCSGFVYNALRDAGYKVGRTTAQGYRSYGTKVSKADMQPGDLVFFGSGDASHIGIYIGNGQMIHSSGGSKNTASNPGKGVSITNVDYRKDFLEARRY